MQVERAVRRSVLPDRACSDAGRTASPLGVLRENVVLLLHDRVAREPDHRKQLSVMTDRNGLPTFVSLELGKREGHSAL